MLPKQYWELNDEHRDQYFYTAFCIFEAALSDYAIGLQLRRNRILNWSCTSLYYSLVHATRLVCFLEMGDFPMNHNQLSRLLIDGNLSKTQSWFDKSLSKYVNIFYEIEKTENFCLNSIAEEKRRRWGNILDKAKILRNDANYEGLLISHEYNHIQVTEGFRQLEESLRSACKVILPDTIGLFKNFIDASVRNEHWYSFLNWQTDENREMGNYRRVREIQRWHTPTGSTSRAIQPVSEGLCYLRDSLVHRRIDPRYIMQIFSWLEELKCDLDVDIRKAEEVHGHIVMSIFNAKSELMNSFTAEINGLKHVMEDV